MIKTIQLTKQLDAQLNGRMKAEGKTKDELIIQYIREGLARPSSRVTGASKNLNWDLMEELQNRGHKGGTKVVDLIELIRSELKLSNIERFPIIVYLSRTFNIPVGEAKSIGAWVGFGPDDTWLSDAELEEKFYPYVVKWARRDHGFS